MKITHHIGKSNERQAHQLKICMLSLKDDEVNGQTTTDICTCDTVLAAQVYCTIHECDAQA
jgi:hypothetical protein